MQVALRVLTHGGGVQGLGHLCESHPNRTRVRLVSWDSSSALSMQQKKKVSSLSDGPALAF